MLCTVNFPPIRVDTIRLDQILVESKNPHSIHYKSVKFIFSDECVITIDGMLRILSLANQILCSGKRVEMVFEGDPNKLMGYLAGVKFFEFLDPIIEVQPSRPNGSSAGYVGNNAEVVEVMRIGTIKIEQIAVSKTVDSFLENIQNMSLKKALKSSLFTILGEFVSNIQRHSSVLELDGFIALQRYFDSKQKFCIAASDSSFGLIETLRPVLETEYPKLVHLEDSELIKLMFTRGLSRFGDEGGGTGLCSCKRIAAKFNAMIEARQNFSCFRIAESARKRILIHTNDCLPYIWGTHICINFSIDA